MNTSEINLDTSDIVAIVSALVAALSSLYARWAWGEARRANEISLSGHRKEIYDAFSDLKIHMQQKAEFAEPYEVSKFYYPSRSVSLYLPKTLADQISKYYTACFWVAEIHRKSGGITSKSMDESHPHLEVEKSLAPMIDSALSKLIRRVNA